ncbi:MAG: family 16 glycosylhydrolase [Spirochaetia bacterium]|nr:family 16 glycosylhydrolase [Spirochaetia bacterium]
MNLTKKFLGTVLTVAAVGMMGCPPKTTEEDVVSNKLSMEAGTAKIDGKEVAYDMKSGKDCFKLYFSDDFNYTSKEQLFSAPLPGDIDISKDTIDKKTKNAWFGQLTWNNTPDAIEVKDGALELYVKRVDPETYPTPDGAQTGTGQDEDWHLICDSICGGVTFNKEIKYGYLEAKIMMPEKKYSEYWPGFYTEGYTTTTEDGEKKATAGYEFDIFEPMGTSKIDQPTHWRALQPGDRLNTLQKQSPLEFNKWITASVAWTPDKVAYYLDGQLSYVIYNDNHNGALTETAVKKITESSKATVAKKNNYQIVANVPQEVILVVAIGKGFGAITGATLPTISSQEPGTSALVYKYDSFKYYEYVGTED